jgi:hypothetical protein
MEDMRKVLGQATHKTPIGFVTWMTCVIWLHGPERVASWTD